MAKFSQAKVKTSCASLYNSFSDARITEIMGAAQQVAAEGKRGIASNEDYIQGVQNLINSASREITKLTAPTVAPTVVGPTTEAPAPTTKDAAKAQIDNDARAAAMLKDAKQQWETTYEIDEDGTKWAELTPVEQLEYAQAVQADDGTSGDVADRVQMAHLAVPSSSGMGVITKQASATNPDSKNEVPIPQGVTFGNAKDAAQWLAKNATSYWLRGIMQRLTPFLGDVRFHVVSTGTMVPQEVANELNAGSRGLAVLDPTKTGDENLQVYIHADKGNTEVVWAHELIHAATIRALAAGGEAATKLKALAHTVSLSLGTDRGAWPINNDVKRNAHEFFKQVFNGQDRKGDADEFLAYGFTSPAFQEIMQNIGADGRWLPEYRATPTQQVPRLTLWQKFMDTLAGVFGLPKKYAQEIEKITRVNSEIEARNATEGGRAKLADRMEGLLVSLLQSAQVPISTPISKPSLAAVSTRPIQSGNKVIDAMPGAVASAWDGLKHVASKAAVNLMLTDHLLEQAAKVVPATTTYEKAMNEINVAKTRQEQKVADILTVFNALPSHEKGTKGFSVNALIKASTTDQKWAFKPDWLKAGEHTEIDPDLKEWFDKKLSSKGREVVMAVFRHGHESLLEMQATATESANSEFDVLIKDATDRKDTAEVVRLTKLKRKELADFQTLFAQRSAWPYAPLRRFGSHVVMGMSARYVEAKANNDAKVMRELESNGDHYFVAFAETKQQANAMVDKIKDKFAGGDFGTFEKLDQADSMLGGRDMLSALRRFRNMALEEGDQKTDARVKDLTRKLYLMLLAENSARKGELNRRNIAGADEDMMRSFATNGRATAHFIAALKTGGKVDDALQDMRSQVRKTLHGREERQRYFNEIMRRHSMSLTYQPNQFVDSTLAMTSGYMLLSNPSYFLMNATQPWMMSLPMMAGKHTMLRAAPELLKAYRGMAAILKDGKLDGTDYALLPNDVREMVKKLADKGVISIELSHDMGTFRSSPDNRAMDAVSKATGWVRSVAQSVETLNRLTTAIAALRLEKAKGASDEQAVEYAAKLISGTHGNYTGFNAPRFMRTDLGRVATQFRKFQLIQLTMFAKLAHQSLKGASKEERVMAWKVLGWNLSMLGAIGGMAALPGFAFISLVLGKIFGDKDEPEDLRAKITRDYGKPMADLLWGGVSQKLGAPVGSRIGAGGMLSLLPYTDIELSRDGYAAVAIGLAGPTIGGVLPRMADGAGLMAKGDLWKGAEQMAPSGFANFSKSMRFAVDGVTQRNGDVALNRDEIGFLDVALQAVGLPTNTIQDRSWLAGAKFDADKFYNERTTQLKRSYADAVESNDPEAMRDAREAWQSTQVARRELGYKVQPLQELLKAPAEKRKREATMQGGVATTKANAGFVSALQ